MSVKIKCVEKGYGEGSIFFSTNQKVVQPCRVDEIKEEAKQISDNSTINVYRGYIGENLAFEMGASIDVTVTFESV